MKYWIALCVTLMSIRLACLSCYAHALQDEPQVIHVESRRVLVPLMVARGEMRCSKNKKNELYECSWEGISIDNVPYNAAWEATPIRLGMITTKDFRLYEDGIERHIDTIESIRGDGAIRNDNMGVHSEWSWSPIGMWSSLDRLKLVASVGEYYVVTYSPPISPQGSCHSVRMTGKFISYLSYRRKYCVTSYSPGNIIQGTEEHIKLESYIAS